MFETTIANTRRKKLTKLVGVSTRMIKDHGFKFFFIRALSEFKKQKMRIFSPDVLQIDYTKISTEVLSEFDTYQLWLNNNQSILNDTKYANLKKSDFKFLPKLDIILQVNDDDNFQFLKDSTDSVLQQSYEKFNLIIFYNKSLQHSNEKDIQFLDQDSRVKIFKEGGEISINTIISHSEGDFVAFMNCGDILQSNTLFHFVNHLNKNQKTDLLYTDEDLIDKNDNKTFPFFKPDWSPYLFLSMDYISRFFLVKKTILKEIGEIKIEYGKFTLYDLILRISEITKDIFHVQLPLCSVRKITEKNPSSVNGLKALKTALSRRKINGEVLSGTILDTFRVKYPIQNEPKVSIIIPTKDQKQILKRCIKSIEKKTDYKNWEIIIIDNNSEKDETISYLKNLPYKIIRFEEPFNFSKINNLAVSHSSGELLLFLNDDVAALKGNWLNEMVGICMQNDVGAVGPKLVLGNNSIQHAGELFLKTGSGFHPYQGQYSNSLGYQGFLNVIREYSAVTGACLLTKRKLFDEIGGFDENFDLYYGDADLCFKIMKAGYRIIYTPFAVLLHEGSTKTKEISKSFFAVENHYHFIKKWPLIKKGDPYYNPNLGWNYQVDIKKIIT